MSRCAGPPTRQEVDTFDRFFARELPSLEAVAFSLTGRRALAEELAQEAMLAVYRRWATLKDYDDPAAFARRVVANKAVSVFRRTVAETRALNRVRAQQPKWVDGLEPSDERLWGQVRKLPRRQAQAVALRYVGELETDEIAEVLGCAEPTVRVLLHRARKTLAERLGEHDDEVERP